MAQRLATEYVKTCLRLTRVDMSKFMSMCDDQRITSQVKVLENGNHEFVFQDDCAQAISLTFEQKSDEFHFYGSCRINNSNVVNFMRKVVSEFKGDAIVHRVYHNYKVVYSYHYGKVVKIVEVKDMKEQLIYEHKNALEQFEKQFHRLDVEKEIQHTHHYIDQLLALRYHSNQTDVHAQIDDQLKQLAYRLFVLEA